MGVVGAGGGGEDEDDVTWARVGLAPLMATLLLPIIIGVVVLIKCVYHSCCVRRTTTKEEMYGLEGRMTMLPNNELQDTSTYHHHHPLQRERSSSPSLTTPSASLLGNYISDSKADKVPNKLIINNNNSPAVSCPTNDVTIALVESSHSHHANVDSDHLDTLKRATGKRQLPDLPQIPQSHHTPRRSSSVLSHDTTSELYATVGDVPNSVSKTGIVNPYAHLARRQLDDQMSNKPSTSRGITAEIEGSSGIKGKGKSSMETTLPSSDSETYATTSNHPYAKVKRNPAEHPYARVRNSNLGNDEETDTDNYDLPQPYAQTRGRPMPGVPTSNQNQSISQQPSSSSSSSAAANPDPVPPRRIGRQWRRGSHPSQGQNDTTTHFSGDSQDSRGYTSISVREPLSNIRNQIASTRHADSHYATVSDDSEEMYAAIDDSSEGNYMQIADGERPARPSWLERREANSPLPPVPAVPPPETPGENGNSSSVGPAPTSPSLAIQSSHVPPVYAQVTKKPKKGKALVTPTASNASTSSQVHSNIRENTEILSNSEQGPSTVGVNSTSPSISVNQSSCMGTHHSSTSAHHHHHRSKSRTLMDNSNLLEASLSENRRWSKADISYSEFEVVREGFPPETKKSPKMPTISLERTPVSPRNSLTTSITEELVDEDNYNLIADNREGARLSRGSKRSSGGGRSKRRSIVDSDNYQEIDHLSNNTYQEIGGGKEPSDHYQEIGAGSSFKAVTNGDLDDDEDEPNPLYQVIRKKEDDYEDDEEDEFYEKVKPSVPAKSTLSVNHPKDRKHGYEKLKRKGKSSPSPKTRASDEEEEEDDDGRADGDDMYERVKYPPYERLKESRSDLAMNDIAGDEDEGSNFYEHIGYSRVKPRGQRDARGSKSPTAPNPAGDKNEPGGEGDSSEVDLNQLYAVVDKSKKKNKNSSSVTSKENNSNNNNAQTSSTESNLRSPTPSTNRSTPTPTKRSGSSDPATPKHTLSSLSAGVDLEYIDDSIDIEYI